MGEAERNEGVIKPMKTRERQSKILSIQNSFCARKDKQLLIQFEAVARAAPLLRMESGKTSLGRTHAIGP